MCANRWMMLNYYRYITILENIYLRANMGSVSFKNIIVVYWPSTRPNMPFQRRGSCIFGWRKRAWLTIWDKVKSHGTVKLMHRKRVTCELHVSYFRSMTIKHVIPEILSGRLTYHITRWRQEVSLVWRPDPLVTRCGRESQHPAESWAPGPPVEQPQENGKETLMAIRVGVNMLQFCSVSNSLSHEPFHIKWEVYFFKEVFARCYYHVLCWPERNTTLSTKCAYKS